METSSVDMFNVIVKLIKEVKPGLQIEISR